MLVLHFCVYVMEKNNLLTIFSSLVLLYNLLGSNLHDFLLKDFGVIVFPFW